MRSQFTNPIPRTGTPHFREASGQRSHRDSDALGRAHLKHEQHTFNNTAMAHAVRQLQQQFQKLRIRHGGGQAGAASINVRGEYDPTATYAPNDIVVISMGLNQGTYVAMQTVSSVSPTAGAPNWLQLPGGLLGSWM